MRLFTPQTSARVLRIVLIHYKTMEAFGFIMCLLITLKTDAFSLCGYVHDATRRGVSNYDP